MFHKIWQWEALQATLRILSSCCSSLIGSDQAFDAFICVTSSTRHEPPHPPPASTTISRSCPRPDNMRLAHSVAYKRSRSAPRCWTLASYVNEHSHGQQVQENFIPTVIKFTFTENLQINNKMSPTGSAFEVLINTWREQDQNAFWFHFNDKQFMKTKQCIAMCGHINKWAITEAAVTVFRQFSWIFFRKSQTWLNNRLC